MCTGVKVTDSVWMHLHLRRSALRRAQDVVVVLLGLWGQTVILKRGVQR